MERQPKHDNVYVVQEKVEIDASGEWAGTCLIDLLRVVLLLPSLFHMELIFFNEIIALRVKTVCEKLIGFDVRGDEEANSLPLVALEDGKT